jgi:hypothetical protein
MVERLERAVSETGKTRNSLVREAVAKWLDRRRMSKWPPSVMSLKGLKGITRFEESRKELRPPRTPFGALSA